MSSISVSGRKSGAKRASSTVRNPVYVAPGSFTRIFISGSCRAIDTNDAQGPQPVIVSAQVDRRRPRGRRQLDVNRAGPVSDITPFLTLPSAVLSLMCTAAGMWGVAGLDQRTVGSPRPPTIHSLPLGSTSGRSCVEPTGNRHRVQQVRSALVKPHHRQVRPLRPCRSFDPMEPAMRSILRPWVRLWQTPSAPASPRSTPPRRSPIASGSRASANPSPPGPQWPARQPVAPSPEVTVSGLIEQLRKLEDVSDLLARPAGADVEGHHRQRKLVEPRRSIPHDRLRACTGWQERR